MANTKTKNTKKKIATKAPLKNKEPKELKAPVKVADAKVETPLTFTKEEVDLLNAEIGKAKESITNLEGDMENANIACKGFMENEVKLSAEINKLTGELNDALAEIESAEILAGDAQTEVEELEALVDELANVDIAEGKTLFGIDVSEIGTEYPTSRNRTAIFFRKAVKSMEQMLYSCTESTLEDLAVNIQAGVNRMEARVAGRREVVLAKQRADAEELAKENADKEAEAKNDKSDEEVND